MTSLRITLPMFPRRHRHRRRQLPLPSPRWLAFVLLGAILGAIGGASLLAMIAMMVARALFIVFATAFLILFFVFGMGWARKVTGS